MNVTCSECHSVFRVDPGKVPAGGVRARCAVCGAVMAVEPPASIAPAMAPAARGTPRTTAAFAWPHATPVTPAATAAMPTPSARPTPVAAAAPAPSAPAAPSRAPFGTPARPTGSVPLTGALARPGAATPALGARRSDGSGRPINPFLSNDPDQKAKRLARALVSDIVAYHPQLREQGLREGTLKQLFRDEIKKSYEEYIDQVGKVFAESTAHFQEALNDILAAGRKVF